MSIKSLHQSIQICFPPHLLGMKIRYSRFRTLLLTFALGVAIVSFYARVSEYLEEIPVNVPKVESDTPIIIRICPERLDNGKIIKGYQEDGYLYFSKEKGILCTQGGGSGGGYRLAP